MGRDPSSDWGDVTAEDLGAIEADPFEEFCAALVSSEAYDRHDEPELDLPSGTRIPDGGRDILLTLTKPPLVVKSAYQRTYLLKPLTEDPHPAAELTRTAYSCKTGKTWLTKALDNATTGARRSFEVLAEGGFFKLLTNQRVNLDAEIKRNDHKRTPHEHLRQAYWERLKRDNPGAPDPGPRIQILDAKKLVAYLRARRPEGAQMDHWAEQLYITPLLWSLARWRESHEADRREPRWVDDEERSRFRDELLAQLNDSPGRSEDRVAWLVGKPGVGKTRLVLEALASDASIKQRVRVARSADEADRAIDTHRLLRRHPEVVLVVDDCLVSEARSLARDFRRAVRGGSRAHMVLLVPASLEAVRAELPREQVWSLEPLADEHARSIVAQALGRSVSDSEVAELARLSEGFPWFARLLADEFGEAGHRAPADMREAMLWALASTKEASSNTELLDLRRRRARSLLAVSLTPRADWDEFDEEQRTRIAQAVGLSRWQELIDAALDCHRRGLLRRRLGWQFKYVTPQVLERELIAWLLDPTDGPDPGGRTLARFGGAYLESFFDTLTRLGLPATTVSVVVDMALADLRGAELSRLEAVGLLGARLRFLINQRPDETTRELRRMIDSSSLDELRAGARERRGLVWALASASTRESSFEDAEAGLFRLARAENESYVNNATQTWADLFGLASNTTHRSGDQRLGLLARRSSDPEAQARRVALHGLESALSVSFGQASARGVLARSWPQPALSETHADWLRAWSLLAERFADPEPKVAASARRLAIARLPHVASFGLGATVFETLEGHASGWSLEERVRLRDALATSHEHGEPEEIVEARARLEATVAPRFYSERLHEHVGVGARAVLRFDERKRDDELVSEGVEGEIPLRAELGWVALEAARGHEFAYAIGRCDHEGVLFEELRRIAQDNPESWQAQAVVARYIGGVSSCGRRTQAEALTTALETNPREATVVALVLVELGATPARFRWLEASLRAGLVRDSAIEELGVRNSWLADADDELVIRLLGAMTEGSLVAQAAALMLLVQRYRDVNLPTEIGELLEGLLATFVSTPPHQDATNIYWSIGARMLVRSGRAARVAELAIAVLSRPNGSTEFAWRALHAAAETDSAGAFGALAGALEQRERSARLLIKFKFHSEPFEWPIPEVLDWVGEDELRARAVVGVLRVQGEHLPELPRAFLRRFGPRSAVARQLRSHLMSIDGLVASLAGHDLERLGQARGWVDDPEPVIAAFATGLVEQLERSYERHAAQEDDTRHRYGT